MKPINCLVGLAVVALCVAVAQTGQPPRVSAPSGLPRMPVPEDNPQTPEKIGFRNSERSGDSQLDGTRLTGNPAALDVDPNIILAFPFSRLQGGGDVGLVVQPAKEIRQRLFVNEDLAISGPDSHTGYWLIPARCSL